jgi:hypothetical protein
MIISILITMFLVKRFIKNDVELLQELFSFQTEPKLAVCRLD